MAGLKIPGGEEPLGGGEGGVRQRAHQVAGGGRRQVGRERCVRGAAVPFWLRVSFDIGVCINQTQNEACVSRYLYFHKAVVIMISDLIITFDFDYSLHLPMEGREGPIEEEKSKRVD